MASGVLSLEEFPAYLNTHKNLKRYDPSTEIKPNHPWYQIDKAKIDLLLKGFAQAVINSLKGSPKDDKELQHLIRNADKLANVLRSPPIRVALLGAQGAGKSLSTNAIFDCDGLSLTGADGAACTSSVTRYVDYANGKGAGHRFFAEIEFLSADKREALLQEHARSYYQYQHADEDSDDDDDVPSPKKRKRDNTDELDVKLKDTAEDVFVTLFGSRDAFLESWSAQAYRNRDFVRICKFKCEEALQNEGPDKQGVVIKSANDQQALVEQIKPFLTNIPGVNCLWPLVDSITVSFSNDLLRAGLEIIDLPGWGDLNLSRARHVEEINDAVNVVIILTDTIRITSEDKLVCSIRAAVAHHGSAKVKIVATKIDAINTNQLSQYKGGIYDEIKRLEKLAEEEESALDDDEDITSLVKREMLSKYKSYLARAKLQAKVSSRVEKISKDFAAKLQSRTCKELPQVFHTSASEYMEWIKPARINFKDQPSLPVEMTGIPAIRQFLYSLPAEQNLRDYEEHIHSILPGFIERIERTMTDTDRSGGFFRISDDFTNVRISYMAKTLSAVKAKFQVASDGSIATVVPDMPSLKEHIEDLVQGDWCELKTAAFNRTLKNRGTVPKGVSKARGLEDGADWNKDLATLFAPLFHKWFKEHVKRMEHMLQSLAYSFHSFYNKINRVMSNSAANVPTVEKAKLKWEPIYRKVLAKLEGLMEEVTVTQLRTLEWATMEFDRKASLMSEVTDDMLIEVYNSVPELKPPNPKAKKQIKRYVEPKLKFQKKKLSEMFLQTDNHFVDQVINHFQSEFDKAIRRTLDQHFGSIETLLDDFNANIRSQGPIHYTLRPDGKAIRADMQERIPELQEKVDQLKALLPTRVKQDDDNQDVLFDGIGAREDEDDFGNIHDMVSSKRKKAEPPAGCRPTKLIKQEPL